MLSGKEAGRIDYYWLSPITGKKFQSNIDARMFLDLLKATNGDENEACVMFKERKTVKRIMIKGN